MTDNSGTPQLNIQTETTQQPLLNSVQKMIFDQHQSVEDNYVASVMADYTVQRLLSKIDNYKLVRLQRDHFDTRACQDKLKDLMSSICKILIHVLTPRQQAALLNPTEDGTNCPGPIKEDIELLITDMRKMRDALLTELQNATPRIDLQSARGEEARDILRQVTIFNNALTSHTSAAFDSEA